VQNGFNYAQNIIYAQSQTNRKVYRKDLKNLLAKVDLQSIEPKKFGKIFQQKDSEIYGFLTFSFLLNE